MNGTKRSGDSGPRDTNAGQEVVLETAAGDGLGLAVYEPKGRIVANAVAMFREEMRERCGLDVSEAWQGGGVLSVEAPDLAADDDQSFRIRTEYDGDEWTVRVSGSGERGILYGLCEVLDRVERRGDGRIVLPVLNQTSSPMMVRRGTERHWPPSFSDPEGVEENIRLIRALARRRVNALLWIDGWISPAWYRFLEFRHYAPLRFKERQGAVDAAKNFLRRLVDEASAWGMEFFLGTTEMTVPERLLEVAPHLFRTGAAGFPVLRYDCPETWEFYRAKIREMLEDIPGLAGIELWTAEAMDPAICHFDRPEEWPLDRQIRHIYEQTLQAMDDAGRPDARLVCATFTHHAEGERVFEPLCGTLPDRCEGRMKMQVEDFYRFNDPTTLAGRITPGREWIEMDCGGEHRGDWIGWINVHWRFLHDRMRHYHARGVRQFVCRVRGFSPGPGAKLIGDLDVLTGVQSIKYDAFFRWCWDLEIAVDDLWKQCKPPGYPDAMLEFYLLSELVSDKTQNVGSCLVNNNHASFLGSVEHYEAKMRLLDVYGNDECRRRGSILEPSQENLERIVQEKDDAVAAVARMQEILRECADRLPADDYTLLRCTLDYQEQCVRVWRYHTEAFFRYRLFERGLPGGEYERLIGACRNCEAQIRRLRHYDEDQADAALALIGGIRSRAWVAICASQRTPKGILSNAVTCFSPGVEATALT